VATPDDIRDVVEASLEPAPAGGEVLVHSVVGRLARGSAVYAVANFGIKAISFLLLPVYTRFLTPGDYGTVSLAEITAAALVALFGLELGSGLSRLYFQYVDSAEVLARYLSSVLRFAIITAALVMAGASLAGWLLGGWMSAQWSVAFYPYVAFAIGAALLLQFAQFRLSLYQAEGRPPAYARLALGLALATALATVALVAGARWGAAGMLLGKLIAAALGAGVSLYLLRARLRSKLEWRFVRETLRLSLPLVPHSVMALGLVVADRFILQHYRSLDEVGLYSVAYTLGMGMYLVTTSISQAWWTIYLDTARADDEASRRLLGRLTSSLAILLAGIATLGALAAQEIVRLLDARYQPAGRLVPLIIAGYLLHAYFGLFQLAALHGKRTYIVLYSSLIALTSNVLLNLWWVPHWGMYGAAYATLAAYAIEAVAMYVYAQRVYCLPYQWFRMVAALMVTGGAIALTQLAWPASQRPWAMLAALVSSGGIFWLLLGGRRAFSPGEAGGSDQPL